MLQEPVKEVTNSAIRLEAGFIELVTFQLSLDIGLIIFQKKLGKMTILGG